MIGGKEKMKEGRNEGKRRRNKNKGKKEDTLPHSQT